MSLETYTGYIPALVDSNPTPTDPVSEGDDHVRGIKSTLSTTFSGFTEESTAVTVKASDINAVCAGGVASALPPGMIAAFAMDTVPNGGWLECRGTASRTTYAALFAAIGTTWGEGDGSTTFNLPDLRGAFLRGWSAGAQAIDPDRVFASYQASNNLAHTHTINNDTHTHTMQDAGLHSHNLFALVPDTLNDYEGGSGKNGVTLGANATDEQGTHSHTINNDTHNHTAVNSGGSESRPFNVAIAYFIKT